MRHAEPGTGRMLPVQGFMGLLPLSFLVCQSFWWGKLCLGAFIHHYGFGITLLQTKLRPVNGRLQMRPSLKGPLFMLQAHFRA